MERFEFCICVVEKMRGGDHIRFKYILRKFDMCVDALKYAEEMKKNIAQVRGPYKECEPE